MIKKNILLFLGFFLIGLYIFFRFIYQRINDSLFFVSVEGEHLNIKIFFVIFMILIFILSAYMVTKNIIQIFTSKSVKIPNNILTQIISKILMIIQESLLVVNDFIAESVPDSYEKLKAIILFWHKLCKNKYYIFLIIFVMLPYVILGMFFVIDTFIFFKFYYFYKVLPIVIFPLLSSILNFYINELLKNIDYIAEDLIITHCFQPDGTDKFNFQVKPGIVPEDAQNILQTSVPEYLALYSLKTFYEFYNSKELFIKKYSLFFMYTCYFISCLYIFKLNYIYICSLFLP